MSNLTGGGVYDAAADWGFGDRCSDNSSTLAYLLDQLKVKQSKDTDIEMDDSSRQAVNVF